MRSLFSDAGSGPGKTTYCNRPRFLSSVLRVFTVADSQSRVSRTVETNDRRCAATGMRGASVRSMVVVGDRKSGLCVGRRRTSMPWAPNYTWAAYDVAALGARRLQSGACPACLARSPPLWAASSPPPTAPTGDSTLRRLSGSIRVWGGGHLLRDSNAEPPRVPAASCSRAISSTCALFSLHSVPSSRFPLTLVPRCLAWPCSPHLRA